MSDSAGNDRQSAAKSKLYILVTIALSAATAIVLYDMNKRIYSLQHELSQKVQVNTRSKRIFSGIGSTFPPFQTSLPPLDDDIWRRNSASLYDQQRAAPTDDPIPRSFGADILNTVIAGTTYVRWGRTTCPHQSSHVYSGYIAGPKQVKGSYGSGSDLQCVPKSQQITGLLPFIGSNENSTSYTLLAPATYDKKDTSVPSNQLIDCSICLILRRAQIMIPEGKYCPSPWIKEYEGFLMAATGDRRNRAIVNHICMDRDLTVGDAYRRFPKLEIVRVRTGECSGSQCRSITDLKSVPCIVCSIL